MNELKAFNHTDPQESKRHLW